MIRHRASLAAVLVALMLAFLPAQAVLAAEGDSDGTGPHYYASDPDSPDGGRDADSGPVDPGGHGQSSAPEAPGTDPGDPNPVQPDPVDPNPVQPNPALPTAAPPTAPAPEPSASASMPAPTDAAASEPTTSSASSDPTSLVPLPSAPGSPGAPASGAYGTSSASAGADDTADGAERSAAASTAIAAAGESPPRTIGGLLAFTGAGAALVLAALILLVIGLLMLWRTKVDERASL
jgi:hypothetical protein